jgi:hypothetical protein
VTETGYIKRTALVDFPHKNAVAKAFPVVA